MRWRLCALVPLALAAALSSAQAETYPGKPVCVIAASAAGEPCFRETNLTQRGLEPVLNTPGEFTALLNQDRVNAKRVVERSGLTPQ
jgi:tripartite-type tricarboxylate transporter receptor subunit TctC